ncbi:hypothetical protein A8V01_16930 [Novosphingobium guangzhouense]|uniref:Uncharacterized protein n=1 Tax=Novosphingobium guangzhouense TaxID=1850347 RepID=A0A2K2G382_9SPHN|nr:hypothetical protein A8V01_16930 [Novosphingobium guangzhouense]
MAINRFVAPPGGPIVEPRPGHGDVAQRRRAEAPFVSRLLRGLCQTAIRVIAAQAFPVLRYSARPA